MKIKSIEAVNVKIPQNKPTTPARRQSWRHSAPIGLPMNKFPEFPPDVPTKSPGIGGGGPVWAKITAEDGTWGLGRTGFGEPIAALVDTFYAPLLTGRDCFATEHLNDLMWRASKILRCLLRASSATERAGDVAPRFLPHLLALHLVMPAAVVSALSVFQMK